MGDKCGQFIDLKKGCAKFNQTPLKLTMKKVNSVLIIMVLLSFVMNPSALAQNTNKENEGPHWDVVNVSISPLVSIEKKTGKYSFKISPTFEYKSDGEDIVFKDNYIWEINCSMSSVSENSEPNVLFNYEQKFPTNADEVRLESGDRVTSTVKIEFDKKLTKSLRGKNIPMHCAFGFVKPVEYQNVLTGYAKGVFPSYILRLRGFRWKVEGWNF